MLDTLDVAAVSAMPGVVQVVRNGRFAAVVAEREWSAVQALQRLQQAAWKRTGPPIPVADPYAAIQAAASQDEVIFDAKAAPAPAVKVVRVRYTKPWLLHGSVGPSCAVALFEDGALTVWTHTQGVYPLKKALVELTKLPAEKVRCIHTEGSGCYGHNGADDVAADAVLVAMALPGRPIRLQWMREQEHGWEPTGTGMVVEAEATLRDAANHIASWRYDLWSPSHNVRPAGAGGLLAGLEVDPPFPPQIPKPIPMPEGGGDRNGVPLYQVPSGRVTSHFIAASPVRVSALRSLGGYFNVFSIECLMDELARAGGADPVAFRRAHLADPRAIRRCESLRPGSSAGRPVRGAIGGRAVALPSHVTEEPRLLLCCGDGGRGGTRDWRHRRSARRLRRGQRRGGESGRHPEPDRRRHRPVPELDRDRGGHVRRRPPHRFRLERLSHRSLPGRARRRRGPCPQPPRRTVPGRWRGRAGAGGRGAGQCAGRRHGPSDARIAAQSRSGEGSPRRISVLLPDAPPAPSEADIKSGQARDTRAGLVRYGGLN